MHRCDLYRSYDVLERHVLKNNIWRHKNASHILLDIAVNWCNKDLNKSHGESVYSIIKTVSFSDINLSSNSLNIAAYHPFRFWALITYSFGDLMGTKPVLKKDLKILFSIYYINYIFVIVCYSHCSHKTETRLWLL